jgi:trafficking protein particle complex subunit 1
MVVYSFYIFDRHSTPPTLPCCFASSRAASLTTSSYLLPAECIYSKTWLPPAHDPTGAPNGMTAVRPSSSDDAKLIFGTVFSLRNMVRKLGGDDDAFVSYRTAQYKLHFYETASNLRLVMLTDTATLSMRNVLHQIYINLWVEYGAYPARPK